MLKEASARSFRRLKSILPYSFLICIFEGVLIALLMFVGSFSLDLLLLFVAPFLILPTLFSTQLMHSELKEDGNVISSRSFMNGTFLYYNSLFRGSYRAINSFCITILAYILFSNIFVYISYGITSSIFPILNAVKDELLNYIRAGDMQGILELIPEYQVEIFTFLDIALIPPIFISLVLFIFMIFYNSFYLYFRKQYMQFNSNYLKSCWRYIKRNLKGELLKNFFVLNWPLFLVLLFSFGAGLALSVPFFISTFTIIPITLALFAFFFSFYFPFFFSNMETLYDMSKQKIISYEITMRNSVLSMIHKENDEKNDENK